MWKGGGKRYSSSTISAWRRYRRALKGLDKGVGTSLILCRNVKQAFIILIHETIAVRNAADLKIRLACERCT